MSALPGHVPTNLGRLRPFVFTQAWFSTEFGTGSGGSKVIRTIQARTLEEAVRKFCRRRA